MKWFHCFFATGAIMALISSPSCLHGEAVTGDAIQKQIDALGPDGGTVQLGPGVITLNAPLRIHYGVTLKGSSMWTTCLERKGPGNVLEITGRPSLKTRYVVVQGLRIRSLHAGKPASHGVFLRDAVEITIRDCFIGPVSGYGIYVEKGVWSLHMDHVAVHGNGSSGSGGGIYLGVGAVNGIGLRDSRVQGNKGPGILARAVSGFSVTGTIVEGNRGPGIRVYHCSGLALTGDYFEKNAHGKESEVPKAHVLIGEPDEQGRGAGGNGVFISGCYFYGSKNNTDWAIVIKKARGSHITANHFVSHVKGGIWLQRFAGNVLVGGNAYTRHVVPGKTLQRENMRIETKTATLLDSSNGTKNQGK